MSAIQILQNTLLRTIDISRGLAKFKYGILDASDCSSSLAQVTRILSTPKHTLTTSLSSTRSTHSAFPFTIPIPRKEPFKQNAVMLALVNLRDNIYGSGRAKTSVQPLISRLPTVTATRGNPRLCTNPACKQPDKLWLRLDLHEKSCLVKYPPPVLI